jgi:hypothetical protein
MIERGVMSFQLLYCSCTTARNQLAQQDDDAGYLQGMTKEVQGAMVPVSAAFQLNSGPLYK